MHKALYWAPRVLGILAAAFISIFALDVFGEGYSFWETLLALAIHLIPTYILIIVVIIAWKRELAGGIIYIIFGLLYIVMARRGFPFTTILVISGPLFLTGALFLVNRFLPKKETQQEN